MGACWIGRADGTPEGQGDPLGGGDKDTGLSACLRGETVAGLVHVHQPFACRIYDSEPSIQTDNYIVLTEENPRLVLNDYKTKKKYGTIQIPIPPPLYELICACRKSSLCKNDYLFTNVLGFPYDRRQYSGYCVRLLRRLFDRPVTLVSLRHSYTSSMIDYNRPIRELKTIATSMGHSVSAQKQYQWICPSDLVPCPLSR